MMWVGSPNFSPGRNGRPVQLIVVHWIVGRLAAADSVFKNPASKTSAHYAVGGAEVHQYVKESDTAWHAGNFDINLGSIGIEHEGGPTLPISDETYETSARLISGICARYKLDPSVAVKPHWNFTETQCPGTLDFGRLINRVKQFMMSNVDYKAGYELLKNERDTFCYPTIEAQKVEIAKLSAERDMLRNERDTFSYPTIEAQKLEIARLKELVAERPPVLTAEEAAAFKKVLDKLIGV